MRLIKLVVTGLGAGAAYLLYREDQKRKAEGKANFDDVVKQHGMNLVKDPELRKGAVELAKMEVEAVKEEIAAKSDEAVKQIKEKKDELEKEFDKVINDLDDVKEDE